MNSLGSRGYIPFRSVGLVPFFPLAVFGLMYLAAPSKEEGQDLQRRQALGRSVLEKTMGDDLDFSPRERVELAKALGCEVSPVYSVEFHVPEGVTDEFTVENGTAKCYVSKERLESYLNSKSH